MGHSSCLSLIGEPLASGIPGGTTGVGLCSFGFLSRLRGIAGMIGMIRRFGVAFLKLGLGVIDGPRRGAIVGCLSLWR